MIQLLDYANEDSLALGYDQAVNDFANGEGWMFIQGSWTLPSFLSANPDFNVEFAVLPNDNGKPIATQAVDTGFCVNAKIADELEKIFTQIEDEIVSSAQSPTQVDQGEDPSQTGYITLTDQLGDYMQVDDINTLVYANKLYKNTGKTETTEDGKTDVTYTFNQKIPDTNHVYPEGNLEDIKITVEKAAGEDQLQTGDLVTVKNSGQSDPTQIL